ncbi:hypothetical protein EGW08_011907 [Elysia chlorotica]|uniref:Fibronectin type-III domain-containing protein n=1 Tax=Elysia chlorotica TaxID=188477 RepID=A0A3S1BGQ1_ELYCH|nr:hypothetical protein EGW08_011907 [Elysia chlorotica]
MIRISIIQLIGILLVCIFATSGEKDRRATYYGRPNRTAKIQFQLPGSRVLCTLRANGGCTRIVESEFTAVGVNVIITDATSKDAGKITCASTEGKDTVELVVYDDETSFGEPRDIKVEAISSTQVLVSWKNPLKNPQYLDGYLVTFTGEVEHGRLNRRVDFSDSSYEEFDGTMVIEGVYPGASQLTITPYFKHGQVQYWQIPGPGVTYNINPTLWEGPELSIRAVALTPDTVLASLQVLDSDIVSDLETSYMDTSSQTWTDFKVDSDERFAILTDLQPQSTYLFKAKAVLRLGKKEVVTHVATPPSATPAPSNVDVESNGDSSLGIKWQQERSGSVKGYIVTVEEQQPDESYRIHTKKTSTARELTVEGISTEQQYRITVSNFDLGGPGPASEAVLYPEVAYTASPEDCSAEPEPDVDPQESGSTETSVAPYSLDVRVVKQTPIRCRVTWFLPNGDLGDLEEFHILLTSSSGQKHIDTKLNKTHRSINLHPLNRDTSYRLTVEALDSLGNVLVSKEIEITADRSGASASPELQLYVSEIRDQRARLAWFPSLVDPSKLKNVRLIIKKDGPDGTVLLKRTISPSKNTITLAKVPPNSIFYIVVEAIGHDDAAFLSSALTLETPSAGGVGDPVTGAPLAKRPPLLKEVAQLKVTSVDIRFTVGKVFWRDEGIPIPYELKKDVPVFVEWTEIIGDNRRSTNSGLSKPGAKYFEMRNLTRFAKYEVRVKYARGVPGTGRNEWSVPKQGQE